jgi:F-box-like
MAMTQTPTAREAALSAIDKEIDAARRLTRSLLSRRNALAPISVLPPELLARIFRFHALAEPAWSSFYPHGLGWIADTHVCQYWRQVALDDSSLWARILGSSPKAEWVAETLIRAHNAPLFVDLVGTPSTETLALFPPHISHTRELRLRNLSLLHAENMRDICGLDAPELEDFELGVSIASPFSFDEIAGNTFFNGSTPKLRTLTLSQVYIPWSLIPRGQLTQLKIILFRGIPFANPLPDDLDQLVDLLISSPQLEVLAIEFCLPAMLSQVSSEEPIRLPRLSRLFLAGSTSRVTNMLKRLMIPSAATLSLHCIPETPPTHNDHLILPPVAAHFHSFVPVEFKSLRVIANYAGHVIEVAASISPPKQTINDPRHIVSDMDRGAELHLSFDGLQGSGPSSQADILRRVCETLPISDLEFLSITAPDTIHSVDWYELFQHCKKITMIQARGRGTSGLLRALAPPKPVNTPSGSKGKKRKGKRDNRVTQAQAQVQLTNNAAECSCVTTTAPPFPKLTSLLLENLDFGISMPYSGVLGDLLINTLRRRKVDCNTPVKTLTVDHCVITVKRANSLKKHVEKFSWDGEEGPEYSYDDWEDYDYSSDFLETTERLEDYFHGTSQAEWDWFANYSDEY